MNKFKFIADVSLQKNKNKHDFPECPSTVTLNFDPEKAKDDLFRDEISLIIWCCVSYQHLRSQFFNDEIKDFVELLRQEKPQNYQEFKRLVQCSKMCQYGYNSFYSLSDNFWSQVWRYIKNKLHESIQISLFPEEHLEIKIVMTRIL